MFDVRRAGATMLILLAAAAWALPVPADESPREPPRFFRIGTGGERGTYFPIGRRLAEAFSARESACAGPVGCGIPGLLAVAQLSNGSVSNVRSLSAGVLEAALVQADVAQSAWAGAGTFAESGPHRRLRALASLYLETVHVVVAAGKGIDSIGDLRGRRISLDEPGSGTLVTARRVLAAHDTTEEDLEPFYLKPRFAAEKILRGELDGFFIVAGHPTPSVVELAGRTRVGLVPIEGSGRDRLIRENPLLRPAAIPGGTYRGIPATTTVAVGAHLLVRADLDPELVYRVTRVLFSERTRHLLARGHRLGRDIRLSTADDGVDVPLHPGAARYYREAVRETG